MATCTTWSSMGNKTTQSRFTKSVNVSQRTIIANKGGVNIIRLKPVIVMENAVGEGAEIGTIPTGGNTDVGQVFKAQLPDLRSIGFRLGVLATTIRTEDFESYADTAALQAAWVPSDVSNSPNTLETVVVSEGAKSMAMEITKNKSDLDTVTFTFAAEDWSSVSDIAFQINQTNMNSENQVRIRIGDGTGTKSSLVFIADINVFEQRVLNIDVFAEDGIGTTDLSAITTIEFEVVVGTQNGTVYIDDIQILTAPGEVDLEVRNVASAIPTTLGSVVATTTFNLVNSADFFYVVEVDATLVPGQHYSLNIRNLSFGTTVVDMIGSLGEYTQGEFYSSNNDGTTLSFPGGDAFFVTFFKTEGMISTIFVDFDDVPGDGRMDISIVNRTNNKIKRHLVHDFELVSSKEHEFLDIELEIVGPDDEVVMLLVDDATSLATEMVLSVDFRHKPVNVVG